MRTSSNICLKSKRRLVAMVIGFVLMLGTFVVPPTVSAVTIYTGILLGSNEVPPTGSPAVGAIVATLSGDLLTVQESVAGLTGGPAAAAHIHCCVPIGVNAIVAVPFPGFPALTSGFSIPIPSTSP
jgi:CHRD domain-containing protein